MEKQKQKGYANIFHVISYQFQNLKNQLLFHPRTLQNLFTIQARCFAILSF